MPMLEWNDGLSLRIAAIDEQHKKLVGMVNRLHDAMTEGRSALPAIVADMKDYVVEHFATEERYMDAYAYPESAAHKAEHRDFAAKAEALAADCETGAAALSMETLNYLGDWLVTHIAGTDRRMGEYLFARGANEAS